MRSTFRLFLRRRHREEEDSGIPDSMAGEREPQDLKEEQGTGQEEGGRNMQTQTQGRQGCVSDSWSAGRMASVRSANRNDYSLESFLLPFSLFFLQVCKCCNERPAIKTFSAGSKNSLTQGKESANTVFDF